MQRGFRRVFTVLREKSCVSYAKIATVIGSCDVDLIIVKATAPDDLPLPEKCILELLKIFSISPSSLRAFSLGFTRRFGKTRCWRVALKCLLLFHRLLRSVPEESSFRSELLWARSNGLITLYPCRFRDDSSSSASEEYTAFIRSYAQLLDEALDCFALDSRPAEDYEEDQEQEVLPGTTLREKMKEVGRLLVVLPQLLSLIDRVMDCRPTAEAARSFLVRSAMKHIIRDSFSCYMMLRTEIVVVLDNLFQLPYRSCMSAFAVYKKAAVQANQLCEFYEWGKCKGLCGSYEYPFVDRIPQIQITALETFFNGMWQMTESSSSPASRSSSESTFTDQDDVEEQVVWREMVKNTTASKWENSEEEEEDHTNLVRNSGRDEEEMEPLIKFEDDDDEKVGWDWEALLEASVNVYSCTPPKALLNEYTENWRRINGQGGYEASNNTWKMMQICKPNAINPFSQPHCMPSYYGSFEINNIYVHGYNQNKSLMIMDA
ncbi:putative clathrin assembly protein At1g03050 [Juglans microcarpa x Juglans regia]|uniref:putative clathrin assembly protein At1g03050 n=1 Tax=Juglans microcarpa x Juglans regia TaxID=2249226 RepID=UPI001B7DA482|nr:putative clathrin assembly protein At1g03050 [Juglans microcarpa x Juglans regia]